MQVAVSLVLLAAAGVLARSFIATGRADLGFTREPLLTAFIDRQVGAFLDESHSADDTRPSQLDV